MEGGNNLWKKELLLKLVLVAMGVVNTVHGHGTRVGFYSRTCPGVESIVTSTVESHVRSDPTLAASILRLHFHDCFVRGCDASVLIAGSATERTAPPNVNLRGYEVIDDAKDKLEALCPGVVSCADILALAARDSVVLVKFKLNKPSFYSLNHFFKEASIKKNSRYWLHAEWWKKLESANRTQRWKGFNRQRNQQFAWS